jgi:hypothetical protein
MFPISYQNKIHSINYQIVNLIPMGKKSFADRHYNAFEVFNYIVIKWYNTI